MPRKLKANLIDGQIQTQNLALDNLLDNDNQIKTLLEELQVNLAANNRAIIKNNLPECIQEEDEDDYPTDIRKTNKSNRNSNILTGKFAEADIGNNSKSLKSGSLSNKKSNSFNIDRENESNLKFGNVENIYKRENPNLNKASNKILANNSEEKENNKSYIFCYRMY